MTPFRETGKFKNWEVSELLKIENCRSPPSLKSVRNCFDWKMSEWESVRNS